MRLVYMPGGRVGLWGRGARVWRRYRKPAPEEKVHVQAYRDVTLAIAELNTLRELPRNQTYRTLGFALVYSTKTTAAGEERVRVPASDK